MKSSTAVFGLAVFVSAQLGVARVRAQATDDLMGQNGGTFNGIDRFGVDLYTGVVKRIVTDITVLGAVGDYPLEFTRYYNSRAVAAGSWNNNWSGWTMNNSPVVSGPTVLPSSYTLNYPYGGQVTLVDNQQDADTFWRGPFGVTDRMDPSVVAGYVYVTRGDGSRLQFQATSHYIAPSQYYWSYLFTGLYDPHGLKTSVVQTTDGALTITELAGRYLKIFFKDGVIGGQLDHVTASNGQTVYYTYTTGVFGSYGYYTYLSQVTYPDTTYATYTMEAANVNGLAPLLDRAIDPMITGTLSVVDVDYAYAPGPPSGGVWGQVQSIRHVDSVTGAEITLATITVTGDTSRQETRGDGFNRTTTYAAALLTGGTDYSGNSWSQGYNLYNYITRYTDGNSHLSTFDPDPITGNVRSIQHPTDPNGIFYIKYFGYDSSLYYLKTIQDERDKLTTNTLDPVTHLVTRTDYPDLSYETWGYNGFNQWTSHRMRSGGTETREIDSLGRVTAYRDAYHQNLAEPPNFRYKYDLLGRVSDVTDALGAYTGDPAHTISFAYNRRHQVTKMTWPDGKAKAWAYDGVGNCISETDELVHRTIYIYDDFRRVTSVTDPRGATNKWQFSYVPWGSNVSPYVNPTPFVYVTTMPSGKQIARTCDGDGRLLSETKAPGTAIAATTTFVRDGAGYITSVKDPLQNETIYGYDKRNRLISRKDPLLKITQYEHDGASNLTKIIRADNIAETFDSYDAMNRLLQWTDYTGAINHLDYDSAGNWKHFTDAKSAVYTRICDLMSRPTSLSYPVDAGGVVRTETWTYGNALADGDPRGFLLKHQSPQGGIDTFTYDNRGRQTNAVWDSNGQNLLTTWDDANRVTKLANADATVEFGYDNANYPISERITPTIGPVLPVSTPVNADGLPSGLSVSGTFTPAYSLTYTYTGRNQLYQIANNGTPWFTYTYDLAGGVTKRQHSGALDSTNFDYTTRREIKQCQQTAAGDVAFATTHYIYDSLKKIQFLTRDEDAGKGDRYGYDLDEQLNQVWYNANNPQSPTPQGYTRYVSYNLDSLNRISVTDNSVLSNYTQTGGLNQYTTIGGLGLQYNNNFNLYNYNGWTYLHDNDKQLTSVSGPHAATMRYDGLGRQIQRTVDAAVTNFVYRGNQPIMELDGNGNVLAMNFYGNEIDEMVARYKPGGVGYLYPHANQRGDVMFLLDQNGVGIEKYTYDIFGAPTITDWSGNVRTASLYGMHYLWQGRDYIPEAGIYNFRHRHYLPSIGRFLQTDPLGLDAGDANLFRFGNHNPANRIDPMGLIPDAEFYVPSQGEVRLLGLALAVFGIGSYEYAIREVLMVNPELAGAIIAASFASGVTAVTLEAISPLFPKDPILPKEFQPKQPSPPTADQSDHPFDEGEPGLTIQTGVKGIDPTFGIGGFVPSLPASPYVPGGTVTVGEPYTTDVDKSDH